jgi:hypothetical protein
MIVIHHYVTVTEDRESCLKDTFLDEELANVDFFKQQKILCVEGKSLTMD